MGFVTADITIVNATDLTLSDEGKISTDDVRKVSTTALVDSGAFTLIINEEVQKQLGLKIRYSKPCRTADGKFAVLDVAGPVEVLFENRMTMCEAVISPGLHQVSLGVIPLEGMDVVINPVTQKLAVNPEHPDAGVMLLY